MLKSLGFTKKMVVVNKIYRLPLTSQANRADTLNKPCK